MMLHGRSAIVTGAGGGLGRSHALTLARYGAKVAVNDLDQEMAEAVAREIRSAGGQALAFGASVTDEALIGDMVARTMSAWGRVDILINNAGYTLDAPLHKMSDEWFQRMLDIHTVVPFRMCRAVAPHMREPAKREREEGIEVFRKIVNISSISGTMGNAGQANYAAGKSAVVGLTKTLAKEWGQFKINVNAVAFGYIETRLTASKDDANTIEIDGEKVQLGIPDQLRSMASMLIPLGRSGTPKEAAGGVFLLCTPWSNYIHGQVLTVSGGNFGGMIS
jgi:3-oxoacyl-[acyl-carrier protein] reductase